TSMAQSIIQSVVPFEITDHIMKHLKEEGLPSLVTCNITEGAGFEITLDGCQFSFGHAEQASPEIYLARGYVMYV
ncbi:hypothetical protein BDN67DRAFT_873524, partial [Paxillus ammoniavirescens]